MKALFSDEEYTASTNEWKVFLQSRIWHDIQLFMQDRISSVQEELVLTDEERMQISKNTNKVYEDANILRGRIRESRDILLAPEIIFEELNEKEEDSDDR